MLIYIDSFKGELPGMSVRLLPGSNAQLAQNCKLWKGEINTINEPLAISTLGKSGTVKSVYLYENTFWFHWLDDTDCARGPIASDTSARTFYTVNDGSTTKPQKTDNSIGPAASAYLSQPVTAYNMGVPAPSSAPTVALGAGGGCASEEKITKAWKYSFVSIWGEEGAMSPASSTLDVCPGQSVNLSGLQTSAGAGYNITHQRIYRINTGTSGGAYQLVGTQSLATTYADSVADTNLGAVSINDDYDEPPDDMGGLLILPNGIAAGFSGNDVCLSEPYIIHAWPIIYRQPCDYNVVAIGAYDQNIVVGTEGTPYLLTGVHPSSMSMNKLNINQACVSKRGMASLGRYGVVYPSPDGLVLVGPRGTGVVTEGIITKDEWDDYDPSSIEGYAHEGRYFGFSSTKAFIFDPRNPENGLISIDGISASAGYRDLKTDNLYFFDSDSAYLKKWDSGSSPMTYTWTSKDFIMKRPTCMTAAQVRAATYSDLTFKLYSDGVLKHTESVTSGDPFRMPSGYLGENIKLQVTGTDAIYDISVASTPSELAKT